MAGTGQLASANPWSCSCLSWWCSVCWWWQIIQDIPSWTLGTVILLFMIIYFNHAIVHLLVIFFSTSISTVQYNNSFVSSGLWWAEWSVGCTMPDADWTRAPRVSSFAWISVCCGWSDQWEHQQADHCHLWEIWPWLQHLDTCWLVLCSCTMMESNSDQHGLPYLMLLPISWTIRHIFDRTDLGWE